MHYPNTPILLVGTETERRLVYGRNYYGKITTDVGNSFAFGANLVKYVECTDRSQASMKLEETNALI